MNQKIIYSSALLVGLGSPQAFAHKEKAHTPQNRISSLLCVMIWGMEIWGAMDSHTSAPLILTTWPVKACALRKPMPEVR